MPLVTWYMFWDKQWIELEGYCIFKKEVKWHGNITYPYLSIQGRVDARNYAQQDLSWHAGSLRGNIFVLHF